MKFKQWVGLCLSLLLAIPLRAVIIEGTTPSGTFKTVGLDAQGRFQVSISTGVTYHVVTDTGSVTQIQSAVEVKGNAAAVPVPVSGAGGAAVPVTGSFSVLGSTVSIIVTGRADHSTVEFAILPVNILRKQSIVCNNDDSLTLWMGGAGVTALTGIPLTAGGCMSPDVPASFVGALNGISSTTAVSTGTISFITFQ